MNIVDDEECHVESDEDQDWVDDELEGNGNDMRRNI
jgi:hypothetical protein